MAWRTCHSQNQGYDLHKTWQAKNETGKQEILLWKNGKDKRIETLKNHILTDSCLTKNFENQHHRKDKNKKLEEGLCECLCLWGKRIGIVSIHLPLPMIPASLFGVIYLLKTKPTLRNNSELADTWFEADNNQPRLPLKNYTFVYLQNNLNPTQKQYPNRTFSRTVMAGISAILARSLITFLT